MARVSILLHGVAGLAMLSLAACASDGSISGGGSFGASGGGSGSGGGGGSAGSAATASLSDDLSDGSTTALASVGTLVGDVQDDGDLDNGVDPLARVTIADEAVGSSGGGEASALSVALASDGAQQDGDVATLGVLSNGQVVGANQVADNGNGDLIGAAAGDSQVVGEGQQQQVSVDLLDASDSSGQILGADVLTNGDIVAVQPGDALINPTGEGLGDTLNGVTDQVGALPNGDG